MSWFETLLKNCYGPLQLQPRAKVSSVQWNMVVDAHAQGSWWHRYEWIDYCLAYKGGTDYSFVAFSASGEIVAIYPLIHEGETLALGGNPLVPALLVAGTPGELVSASMHIGNGLVNIVARHHGVACADIMLPPTVNGPLKPGTVFEDTDDMDDMESVAFSTRVIDLSIPKEERWKAVRKSYHQLIRRAEESHTVHCHMTPIGGIESYCELHRAQYGNARPLQTYEIQKDLAKNDMAFPFIITDHKNLEQGAVLWYVYKGMAYYASGVFKKDNIAHDALWHSMNHLAWRGVKYAELGWQGRATDKKGQAVEFFKRGFGGTDWPVPCLRRTFLTHHQEAAS